MHRTCRIRSDLWNEEGGDLSLTDHEQLAILGARRDEVLLPALQDVIVQVQKDGLELDLNTAVITGGGGIISSGGVQLIEDNDRLLHDAREPVTRLVDVNRMITQMGYPGSHFFG